MRRKREKAPDGAPPIPPPDAQRAVVAELQQRLVSLELENAYLRSICSSSGRAPRGNRNLHAIDATTPTHRLISTQVAPAAGRAGRLAPRLRGLRAADVPAAAAASAAVRAGAAVRPTLLSAAARLPPTTTILWPFPPLLVVT